MTNKDQEKIPSNNNGALDETWACAQDNDSTAFRPASNDHAATRDNSSLREFVHVPPIFSSIASSMPANLTTLCPPQRRSLTSYTEDGCTTFQQGTTTYRSSLTWSYFPRSMKERRWSALSFSTQEALIDIIDEALDILNEQG